MTPTKLIGDLENEYWLCNMPRLVEKIEKEKSCEEFPKQSDQLRLSIRFISKIKCSKSLVGSKNKQNVSQLENGLKSM